MESSNTFKTAISVANLAQLADVHVARWDEGTAAWVTDQATVYILRKASAAVADGFNIIAPNAGSPIAGAAGARWHRQLPNGGVVIATFGSRLITDVTATSIAPLLLPSVTFTPPQQGLRAIVHSSFAGTASRDGLAQYEIQQGGANLIGRTVQVPVALLECDGALTVKTSAVLAVVPQTFNVRILPTAPMDITILGATAPTTDHATIVVLLTTD